MVHPMKHPTRSHAPRGGPVARWTRCGPLGSFAVLSLWGLLGLSAPLSLSACDGFAEIKLPIREAAPMRVEAQDIRAMGPGLIQLAIDGPEGLQGPAFVVVPPVTRDTSLVPLNFAIGPCPSLQDAGSGEPALRLCVAVQDNGASDQRSGSIEAVIDFWPSGRRFNVRAELEP